MTQNATRQPAAPVVDRDLGRRWLQSWDHVGFVMTGLLVGSVQLVVMGLAFAGVGAVPALGLGILMLLPTLWAALGLAALERSRLAAFGEHVEPPADGPGLWSRGMILHGTGWRAVAYASLQGTWACVTGAVVASALVLGIAGLLAPGRAAEIVGAGGWFSGVVRTLAVVLVIVAPLIARGSTSVTAHLAQWLIGRDPQREISALNRRVETLTTTRTEAVDSVEAERRRIERDLHDGPQQRLVSIAMDLGMARAALDADPDKAREMLDRAHSDSKAAITEMRQVARGIAPPILTDRGLDAALTALAGRAAVPVSVEVTLPAARLDPTIEAIAYFCVSEALTNVVKHARASRAQVVLAVTDGWLHVTVTDDGVGGAVAHPHGADATSGTGLTGLRQRVAAVDGALRIDSPAGGPTSVRILLPIRERSGS